MSLRIAVLGPGGVGGFVAAALARAGADVIVVARPQTVAAIDAHGLQVTSELLGRFTVHPPAVDGLAAIDDNPLQPLDCLIVATKATGLDGALARVPADLPALVVPLLNGVEQMATLRRRFGPERVVAAVIRIESDRPRAGEIVQTSPGARIDIAAPPTAGADPPPAGTDPPPAGTDPPPAGTDPPPAGTDPPPAGAGRLVEALGAALRAAGLEVRLGASEPDVLWSKLARLCPLALTTAASDRPLGSIRDDPRWRSALDNAVAETVAVALAEGADLRAADTLAELEAAHPGLGSSMQRDVRNGREPELDAIAGAVMRAGARHRLRCPTVQWLAERVAARAATGRPQRRDA